MPWPSLYPLILVATMPALSFSAKIDRFVLVDAVAGQEIMTLEDGAAINVYDLPAVSLSIRAITDPPQVGSVAFEFDGAADFHTENAAPYYLFGDNAGSPSAHAFVTGPHRLTAVPFAEANGQGARGEALTVDFTIESRLSPPPAWDTMPDTWVATDGLGRAMPTHEETGPPRAGKTVALFYYLWHGQHSTGNRLYDITKILRANPDNPQWGPVNYFHFWGEPLFGYYFGSDQWVHRKNMQMLTDAGVDVIFFDVTNGFTYDDYVLALLETLDDIRARGGDTPKIGFLTNSRSGEVVQRLYTNLYIKGLHQQHWFYWKGKPLILAKTEEMTPETLAFFNVRRSWAWQPGEDKWPWLEHEPQQGGWTGDAKVTEQMVAQTAQHPGSNGGLGIGKSRQDGVQPRRGSYEPEQGLYFAEQLERALHADPEVLFLTQWNEWIAQRFVTDNPRRYADLQLQAGDSYFVDVFSQEFNRDMEPMKDGYFDNYYYQMVAAIRRFKGTRPLPLASAPFAPGAEIWSGWEAVTPEYRDDIGDTMHRNHPGYGDAVYVNETGRNDFRLARVARDMENTYFYVETSDPITPQNGRNWMNLFIGMENSADPAFEGFQFLVQPAGEGADAPLALHRSRGGWDWQRAEEVAAVVAGSRMIVTIPREALGLEAGRTDLEIRFKWADNMQSGSVEDWILNGDTAPSGRFAYRYSAADEPVVAKDWIVR